MRDFTLITYRQLLEALLLKGYAFSRFDEWAGREGQSAERQALNDGKISLSDRNDTSTEVYPSGSQYDKTLSAKPYTLSPKCILSI